jgi:hypothetical protein
MSNHTTAERIDRAIQQAANAFGEKEAAALRYEDSKDQVVAVARRHGTPDGDSWRLRGRKLSATVTLNHIVSIEPAEAARLDGPWSQRLFAAVVDLRPTERLRELIHDRRLRRQLPERVKGFLERGIKITRYFALRFDGGKQ